ncbi:MAG: hypothetical protein HOV94_31155 [Saccharothrix sp.]|nr:hypothetical protein [Saccharothrix sp.]
MSLDPAHGPTPTTLDQLLMRRGALDDLDAGITGTWVAAAARLAELFTGLDPENRDAFGVCRLTYAHDDDRPEIDEMIVALQLEGLSEQVVAIVEALMRGTGQWDYLRRQEWFTGGTHAFVVDVNYYPDRPVPVSRPTFHKDTAGDNIFANLLFANTAPIEATEWFADLAKPSGERAEWQRRLLPESHLAELDRARAALRAAGLDRGVVQGGVSTDRYTYVSWVDDLVWHATPGPLRRVKYTAEAALRAYGTIDGSAAGAFQYLDVDLREIVHGVELVGSIADHPGTRAHDWMAREGLESLSTDAARRAWAELYHGPEGATRFGEDVHKREELTWRITGLEGNAISYNDELGSPSINEAPAGLSTRKRADSAEETRLAVDKVRAANAGTPRSFLRTWVRIVRR